MDVAPVVTREMGHSRKDPPGVFALNAFNPVRGGMAAPKHAVLDREKVHVRKQHDASGALHSTSEGACEALVRGESASRG